MFIIIGTIITAIPGPRNLRFQRTWPIMHYSFNVWGG
jgi:hypothetical protein